MSLENRGVIKFYVGGETKAFGSTSTPKGILRSILRTLEIHGFNRRQIESQGIDLEAMEQALAKIDERQFMKLLNLDQFHPQQLVNIEACERNLPGAPVTARDPGTCFGNF
ncbi:MAG: hypothetical protein U1E20_06255 [Methylocystis sp.]|uniref:hypothetical protein n=1 Tax=Methylocystis sp. TaxID=1911079 RepID=UPI003946BF00